MKPRIDIGVYCHRFSSWQVRCAKSVAEHTKTSFRLIQVTEPGSAHVNMNRVLERSDAELLVLLDEDAAFVNDAWLPALLQDIQKDDVGIVGAYSKRGAYDEPPDEEIHEVLWTPAYFFALARWRFPDLRFDETIPGDNGMTDVDFCRQVRGLGLKVIRDNRIIVDHPVRDEDDIREIEKRPTIAMQNLWFHAQLDAMRAKWGESFDVFLRNGVKAS